MSPLLDATHLPDSTHPLTREFVDSVADPQQRTAIVSSIRRHERPDQVAVGDPVPALALARLDSPDRVRLDAFRGRQPLLLIFGSYT